MICGAAAVVSCYCEEHRGQRMTKLREEKGGKYKPQTCGICGEPGHNSRSCRRGKTPEEVEELKERRERSRRGEGRPESEPPPDPAVVE